MVERVEGDTMKTKKVDGEAWFAAADVVKLVRDLEDEREAVDKALKKGVEPLVRADSVPGEVFGSWRKWVMVTGGSAILHPLADYLEKLRLQAIETK